MAVGLVPAGEDAATAVRDLVAEARTHHPKLAIPLLAYLKGYGAWMAAKEAVGSWGGRGEGSHNSLQQKAFGIAVTSSAP